MQQVCIQASQEFLEFSKAIGNDLSTPIPMYNFPGVRPGDRWCLCAQRWAQAYNNRKAPKLYLQSTHERTLSDVPLDVLMVFAVDVDEAKAYAEHMADLRTQLEATTKW